MLDDSLAETNETVVLQLGTPTGTSLGTPGTAALTIQDNDVPPVLAIRTAPGGVALSWPTQATGFQLVSKTSLTTNNNWTPVTNIPVTDGASFVVTNLTQFTNRFYRLRQ